jgi:hypothetical protein
MVRGGGGEQNHNQSIYVRRHCLLIQKCSCVGMVSRIVLGEWSMLWGMRNMSA